MCRIWGTHCVPSLDADYVPNVEGNYVVNLKANYVPNVVGLEKICDEFRGKIMCTISRQLIL